MRFAMSVPALCALAILLCATQVASAQTLMENSRIAFVTDRDGNDEIYLMRVDGSELVNLTNNPANDVDPAWSLTGDKIAFASDRDGDFDIYVMDRDGSNVVQVTSHGGADRDPSWSPHGDRLVFASDRDPINAGLWLVSPDGSNEVALTGTEPGAQTPAWSSHIRYGSYVTSGQISSHPVWAAAPGAVAAIFAIDPAWSHAGNAQAYAKLKDGQYELFVVKDGARRRLTTHAADDREPSWAPSDTRLVFRRDDNIHLLDIDTLVTTEVSSSAAVDRDPAWSPYIDMPPDPRLNTKIAYVGSTEHSYRGIYIVDYDGTDAHWIVRHADHPAWSPDGTRIAFSADYMPPSGGQVLNHEIWAIDVDGSDVVRLTSDPAFGADDTDPAWSPDSSQVAFISNRDGNAELYVVGADGSDMRRLTHTSLQERTPAWSPDGTMIAIGPTATLIRVADGSLTVVPTIGGFDNPVWSPDGALLAVDGLKYVQVVWPHPVVSGGEGFRPGWSPDGRKVVALSSRDGGFTRLVYVMNPDGSQPVRLNPDVYVDFDSAPTWSPFLGVDAARITLLNPADGATLPFNTTSVTFAVDIDLHAGGWRWRSNASFPTTGEAGGNVGDASGQATKSGLKPGRTYTINAALVDDAGRLLSPNGTDSVTFTVAPVPIVNITTPTDGQALATGTREAPLAAAIQHHDAHWHWRLNEPFPESGLAGGNHADAGRFATMKELRDGVTYTVHVALVHDDHTLLEPSIGTSATFTTGDPSYVTETVLAQGLSLFALPLDARRMTFGAHELDFTKREGGLTAFDLLSVGSTICVRMEQGGMQAVVGRDNAPLFGSDFAIEPARGYVVNMPEETVVTIEGPPFGARLGAPAQTPSSVDAWAFVVAGTVADSLHVPTGTRLRVRSGARSVTAAITPTGGFITAFVDSRADASVVAPDEPLFVDALTPDGYPIGGVRPLRVTSSELRDAFKLVTLDLRPTRARLLPNYPNPFNPETWIPFELAESGSVGLRIYDLAGSLVRSIDLGTREPGYYVTPADAARWDGRNDAGESVGSGVYVSELRAGASRDVRRLLIGK